MIDSGKDLKSNAFWNPRVVFKSKVIVSESLWFSRGLLPSRPPRATYLGDEVVGSHLELLGITGGFQMAVRTQGVPFSGDETEHQMRAVYVESQEESKSWVCFQTFQ